ncbi:hypothetical protein TVAG_132340 [Trichomonas vaginalis G3]|uniref:GAF domain-containing protein n=1 Tax=Trichomonas vaginalis (strain ATCC PRA-98 / G3) TaxID=412133 RepID=A2FNL6_TRIV3|nr:HD-domain/PDEase-like family [Trichomonas vaginalis G3]EAX93516.1 hypothetical protein TVAG_132340 [Trichomonas vaginalis G3]KAI5511589.1 HD-domain/PDEase-like family [Trichomonas vaginalis G3]|eukprot:XP_001306446.1 hypothetical protein [Trichomonas vaginalis G3]
MKRLTKMHKRRTKYAQLITNLVNKTREIKQNTSESHMMLKQKGRIDRLTVCTQLLESKGRMSSLVKSQPLPNLLPPVVQEQNYDNANQDQSDSFANIMRNSHPEMLHNYFNENGVPRLLNYCGEPYFRNKFFDINIDGLVQALPNILATIPPANRMVFMQRVIEIHRESSMFTQLFENSALITDPFEIVFEIEYVCAQILKCKRVKLLVSSPLSDELTYVHSDVRRTISMSTGLIASVIHRGDFEFIKDPCNSEEIDIAVESYIFEGSKNCFITPLLHPDYPYPFVFVAIDKLRDDFVPSDFVSLFYFFRHITSLLKLVVRELTSITERDMTKLVEGLSEIADVNNAHDMISKIISVSNKLTESSCTRLFTVVGDGFCEETTGIKLGGKVLQIDRGLVCRAAIANELMNYFLPRRAKEFSVLIDDITEPRIWSMVASPTTYKGEVKGAFVLYNRQNGTFFSSKETFLVSNLSKCILPLLHTCCESSKLHESLDRNNVNIIRAYNLTVFSIFKSIQAAGTSNLFFAMTNFCQKLKPSVDFRFLIYEGENLYEAETNKSVPTEPQLLDAICDMKPTAAVNDNFGILVLPILDKENKIYLFEFKAQLMRLKTEEESNGILQCTRILSSLEEQTPKLRIPENVYKITKKSRNSSNKSVKLSKNSLSSSFYNLDVNINTEDPKMPFIPLSLKNIHDEDGITSTSVFDLSSAHSKSDKFIIVSSSRPNINPQSFEMQLEKDKLQIYPFDPFLTSILMSFSKLSTRQLDLHHKIVNMKEIKPVVRSLHLLGNVLACPMPFTDLLRILMVSFTNLFGKCVKLEIFDPPLHDEQETDPNALNLERDRKIYASIKISSPMTPDKSMALSYFADLVLALLASRDEQKPDSPMEVLSIPVLSPELGYNFFNMNVHENVSICAEIFSQFKVNDVLNVSKERVSIWLWRLANNPEEDRFFLTSLDSLQLAYSIFTTYDLFSYFTDSELCAACISFFVRSGFPHMRPDFKYSSYLKHFSKLSNKVLVRITTAMIILADPYCDLLEMSSEETVCGVLEYMIHSSSISVPLLISKMTFVGRRGIDFENINHRLLFTMLVTELSQSSYFFRSIDVFNQYCLLSMESQKMLLYKAQKIVHPYIKVLDLITQQQSIFYRAFSDKVSWLNLKGKTYFQQQHQEEELGNMSLFDAR